jgi:hypothetical protein
MRTGSACSCGRSVGDLPCKHRHSSLVQRTTKTLPAQSPAYVFPATSPDTSERTPMPRSVVSCDRARCIPAAVKRILGSSVGTVGVIPQCTESVPAEKEVNGQEIKPPHLGLLQRPSVLATPGQSLCTTLLLHQRTLDPRAFLEQRDIHLSLLGAMRTNDGERISINAIL